MQLIVGLFVSCGLVCFMLRVTLANAIRVVLLEWAMTLGITVGILAVAVALGTQLQLNPGQLQADRQSETGTPLSPPPATFLTDVPANR